MRASEFTESPLLEVDECNAILNEDVSDEIKQMVHTNVGIPFNKFHQQTATEFSKKLKTWAVTTLMGLQKGYDYNESKRYVDTLKKIINNPTGIANQLIAKLIASKVSAQ